MELHAAKSVNATLEQMRRDVQAIESMASHSTLSAKDYTKYMREWAKSVITGDRQHVSLAEGYVNELEEELVVEKQTTQLAHKNSSRRALSEKQMQHDYDNLHDEVGRLQLKRDTFPDSEKALRSQISTAEQRVKKRTASVQQMMNRSNSEQSNVSNSVEKYEHLLGMHVDAVDDGHARFTFNYIDTQNPSSAFQVSVSSSEDQFGAYDCSPLVPEFDELQEALQKNKKLVAFLRDIRQAFCRYANES